MIVKDTYVRIIFITSKRSQMDSVMTKNKYLEKEIKVVKTENERLTNEWQASVRQQQILMKSKDAEVNLRKRCFDLQQELNVYKRNKQ